jgi:hypothetical protein
MKLTPILIAIFAAGPAFAHAGHIAEAFGHNHWVAGVAIGAAIAVGVWGALKGKDSDADTEDQPETDDPKEA